MCSFWSGPAARRPTCPWARPQLLWPHPARTVPTGVPNWPLEEASPFFQSKWPINREDTGHLASLLVAGSSERHKGDFLRGTEPGVRRADGRVPWTRGSLKVVGVRAIMDCWAWPGVRDRRAGVGLENGHFQQVPRVCCSLQPRSYLLKRKGQTAKAVKQEELGGFKDFERSLEGPHHKVRTHTGTHEIFEGRCVWGGFTTGFALHL